MGVQVPFVYATWAARYPEFEKTASEAQAQLFFNEATVYHANDGTGPVNNALLQSTYLNMLTAHIAQLAVGSSRSAPGAIVGRITNASEGSVSVQTEYSTDPSEQLAFFSQTPYGAAYWAATKGYRTMLYRANPARRVDPWFVRRW